jgi:UDP-N-acetylmuramoyl-L-alanyl-D-glutamate--2,6-diaminopimelate ligase
VNVSLRSLLKNLSVSVDYHGPDRDICDIEYDSRKIRSGALFVAIRGAKADGHHFMEQAFAQGAAACLAEESCNCSGLQIRVPDSRKALAELSWAFYLGDRRPHPLLGVTGTNGKTTITHLLYQLAETAGIPSALIGTLGVKTPGYQLEGERTTPESRDLAAYFRNFLQEGSRAVFMEVSSHAIALKRVHGLTFDAAIFTNLTRDHLDFHADMEDYFKTKASLFDNAHSALINIDDPYGKRLAEQVSGKKRTFSLNNAEADFYYKTLRVSLEGVHGILSSASGDIAVDAPLLGRFNAENIAAALSTWTVLYPDTPTHLQHFPFYPVAGRMERIPTRRGTAVIDYAHTPDAMEKALQAVRDLEGLRRLICVFGCGGDRDHGKRAMMGAVAERYADHILLCNDNPRSEDPEKIIAEIRSGISRDASVDICVDRAEAIRRAYALSESGDILMILGKGAENYMEIKGERIPFQDKKIIVGLE